MEFNWIKPVPEHSSKASCLYCKIEINAKLFDIQRHKETKKHKYSSAPFISSSQTKIGVSKEDNASASKSETYLSLYIAEHSSLNSIDHLTDLCKQIFCCECVKRGAKEMKMHRTKCTHVITEVLSSYFKDLLVKDIGTNSYSLIIDESTDVSVTKQLGVVLILNRCVCHSIQLAVSHASQENIPRNI